MKSVLISIQPKWCELIANGKKKVEVRKTKPKLETPFKVYIYCTKNFKNNKPYSYKTWAGYGKVIGEFVCDKIDYFSSADSEWAYMVAPAGSKMPMHEDTALCIMQERGGLSLDDIIAYFGDEDYKAYFWHISNLVIYDKPRELSEFHKPIMPTGLRYENDIITRPPQSWCYIESEGGSNETR